MNGSLDNLKFRQEPFFLRNSDLGKVSRGFQKIYTDGDDGETLADTVIKTLETVPINSQVFVTGHSLGDALATLCALHISQQFVPSHPTFQQPILYTFASPRVGDPKFADFFKSLTAYRIANSEDFVVIVPPGTSQIMGPEMFGQPIPNSNSEAGKTATPSAQNNKDVINKLVNLFRKPENLLIDQIYEHVGIPLYFTDQRGYLSSNHNMFYIYREALPDSE
ncbi:MAG: lipase family protein [Snowella sp.]|nr:lipase family protein [Snowella sp.]